MCIVQNMFFPRYFVGMPVVDTDFEKGVGVGKRDLSCVCVCWRGKEKEEEEEGNGHYGEFMGAFVRLKINLISAPHFAEPRRRRPRKKRRLLDSTTFLASYNLFFSIFVLAQKAP